MSRIPFDGLIVDASDPWQPVLHEVGSQAPCLALAARDGAGVLQFSAVMPRGDDDPAPPSSALLALVERFGAERGLGPPAGQILREGATAIAGASFHHGDNYLRVWFVADRSHLALVTYVADRGTEGDEPRQCDELLRTLRFQQGDTEEV
ncbi:MAG: hypothetical protein EXR72_18595 [Myxococcales bacterium]|nr:hypothetical protein [Myxococcales bacterium]